MEKKPQPFEYYSNLVPHIERMAATGKTGSPKEWNDFLKVLNAICERDSDKDEEIRLLKECIEKHRRCTAKHHDYVIL